MLVVGIASGVGTFIESFYGGRDAAYAQVYAAKWFELTLGLVTVNLLLVFFRRMPYNWRQSGSVLIHLSVIVILMASAVTRFYGYEGIIPIREGGSTTTYLTDKPFVQLQIGQQQGAYPVRLYKEGDPGLSEKVVVDGQAYQLGVTEFWPHFTEVYQEGEGGPPGFQYGTQRDGEVINEIMLLGDRMDIGQASAWYMPGDFEGELSQSPYGDVRIRIGGESITVPVTMPDGTKHSCAGHTFEITEFQTAFSVGGESNPDGPLTNPMVRLVVTDGEGKSGEKILFAFHPDFSMGHGGGDEDFADLDLLYSLSTGIEFARGGDTGLRGRASFALTTMDMTNQEQAEIPAGEIFSVEEEVLYLNDGAGFSFIPVNIMNSVVKVPSNSANQNLRSAAMVTVKDSQGNEASAVCIKGSPNKRVMLGEKNIQLGFGAMTKPLGYELALDDFVLETYPGSDNPATYESYVLLTDHAAGIEKQRVHIYMNHPLTHRGSKHFQSSYDPDRKGTVLSMNHDPGKLPTYFGYAMISLGFILVLLQNMIWPRTKDQDHSSLSSKKAAALLVGLLAVGSVGEALAQQGGGHEGHNHAPQATSFTTLSDPAREEASRLLIQDFRGRMKPLDTMAREFVMKVAKKTKFQDRQPVDIYLNWVANPTYWWDQPCVAVRYGGLKDLLGVDPSVKHVSPASLFENGQYRIASLVEEAHRTPDRERSKTQRKLISFDERFNLLYMSFQGRTLRMYPIPGDANNTWLTMEEVNPRLNSQQADQFHVASSGLLDGLRSGNNGQLLKGVRDIAALQNQYGAEVLPSNAKLEAELFYNKSHLFSWMMVPLLGCFVIFMGLFLWNLFKNNGARFSFRNPIYSFAMFAYTFAFAGMILAYTMRWIASGRAPLSNGHESLLFISLAAALAGLIFELVFRMSAPAGLASFLTVLILGVSMLSVFDPAIGPLVPVLVSYWLNIHVTIITASYAFLGLSFMTGLLVMALMVIRANSAPKSQDQMDESIKTLDKINFWVLVAGLGTLTIGTLLGGVWANESWGRYWGWDPKETWSLVTIMSAAIGLHFRYIPAMRGVWINSAWTTVTMASVLMTYFGVNFFLVGLHSYGSGDGGNSVPGWAQIFVLVMVIWMAISGYFNLTYSAKRKLKG